MTDKVFNAGSGASDNVFFTAKHTLKRYASGGNVLIATTVLALIVANLPGVNVLYSDFWNQEIRLQVGSFNIFSHAGHPMTMLQFINDALMAVFFFTIGLEIKREVLVGELSSVKQALLPIIAAVGGMLVPVGIYMALAKGTDYIGGAAIPMATDIAFTLGILGMLGSRVPVSLKIFLTTLAVVDDIGGIIVIAAFYSDHIEVSLLLCAIALLGLLFLGSKLMIQSKIFYLIIGTAVWYLFLNSGIHPTIAGVLVAFCIPSTPVLPPKNYIKTIRTQIAHFNAADDESLSQQSMLTKAQMDHLKEIESASDKVISPLQDLEDSLHPIVNYIIIPVFAFANAGITLWGFEPSALFSGIGLAVIIGLVVGKFLGIFLFSWGAIKLNIAPMPDRTDFKMLSGVSVLGGIGFTVSLFIANLTFDDAGAAGLALLNNAKLGIIAGSLLAGIIGYLILRTTLPSSSAKTGQ